MSELGSAAAAATEVIGAASADAHRQESESALTFLRAARAGNVDKIEDILGTVDVNYQNANGLCALHLAAREGHLAVVLKLIERGANVNLATKKGNTPLHVAALAGRFNVVQAVVQCGGNINVETEAGFTAVYMAAQENHEDIVRYLLEHGADMQKASKEGYTPLAVAVREGSDRAVGALLEFGQAGRVKLPALHVAAKKDDVDAAAVLLRTQSAVTESSGGFTPLHIAAHYGKARVAKLLLDHDADVNFKAKNAITPLHVAARWGQCEIIALLANHGADLAARTADGLTPVHCAARNGHQLAVDCLLELCGGRSGSAVVITSAKTKSGLTALHMTAQGDHSDCARLLIHHGALVDDVSKDRLTALHIAAHYGHYATAKLLLDRRCDPDARAVNGFTPLHIACKKHRFKVVQLLLKYGASIDAVTVSGLSPLHIASFVGAVDVVQTLLRHNGAETMQMETLRGETPLHLAAKADQTGTLTMLLRNGADVNAKVKDQQTALHIAARQGSDELAQALLQHGAQPNATTTDGCTPLHIAAKEGHRLVAARLLDHGARADLPTEKGMTPLHIAAKYGQPAVARLLLEHGADINSCGKNGLSPLHVATHYGSSEVEILLLDSGASPHVTAKNGYTPLHIAARTGRALSAAALLDHGAKPSAASKSGFYPVHMAAREGHTEMIRLLFERGASVNSPSGNGIRPLHLCAQEDKVEVAGALLRYGASVNPRTTAGYTPLHTACHFGHVEMARFLIANGAAIDEQTLLGYTPLHQAAQQDHILVVDMLLQQGASPILKTNAGLTALDIARRLGNVSVSQMLKRATGASCSSVGETEKEYNMEIPEKMDDGAFDESDDENEGTESLSPDPYSYLACDNLFESSAYGSSTQGDSIALSASFFGINGSFHFDEKIRSSDNNVSSLGPLQHATKAYYKEDLSELASPLTEHGPLLKAPAADVAVHDDALALSGAVDVKAPSIGCRREEHEADGSTQPNVECAAPAAASSHPTVESRLAVDDHIEPLPPVAVFCAEVGAGEREEMTCRRGKTSAASHLHPGDEATVAVDGQPSAGRLLVLDPWGRPICRRADEDSGGGLLTVPMGTWLATAVDPKGKATNAVGQPVVDAGGKAVVLHDPAAIEVLATPNMTALLDAQGRPVLVPRGSALAACGTHGCLRTRSDARPVADTASGRPVVVPLACRLLPLDADGLDGTSAADATVNPAVATATTVTIARASATAECLREAAERVKNAQQHERPLMVLLPNGSLARCGSGSCSGGVGTYLRFGSGSRIVQPSKDGRLRDSSGKKLVDASGKSLKLGKKALHVADEDMAVVVTNGNEIARDRSGEGWLLLPCGSTLVRVDERTGRILHEDGTLALGPGGAHVNFQPDRFALVLDESGMPLMDGSGGSLIVSVDSDIVEPGRTEHVLRPDGQPVYDHEGAPLRLDAGSALLPSHGDGTVRLQPSRGGGGRVRSADGKLVKVAPGRALAVGPDDKPYIDWLGGPLTVPLGSVLVPDGKPHVLLRHGHVVSDLRGRAVCFESPVELVAPAKLTDVIAARAGSRVAAYVERSLSLLSAPGQDASQAIAVDLSSGLPHLDAAGRPVDAQLTDQLAIYGRTGLTPVEPANTRMHVGTTSSNNDAKMQSQTDDNSIVRITATLHETSSQSSAVNAGSTKRLDSSEEVLCQVSLPTLTMLSASEGSLATNRRSMSNGMDAPDMAKSSYEREWQSIAALDSLSPPAASAAQSPSSDSFLVSFMVDARGGIMRGYRREGMRFIIPPRCVDCPTRINCRLVRQSKLASYGLLPPKMNSLDGQQLASRVLQLSPAEHKFLSPVLLEIPHCAALRGGEREIYAMRSADGQHWSEHWQMDDANEQAARERRLSRTIYGIEPVEQLSVKKVVRLLLPDLPHSLTLVTRLRSDAKTIGSEGGIIESSVVPQLRICVPAGAVNRDTLISLKVLPVSRSVVLRYAPASTIGLGSVVTVSPFLRRFRQPLTITTPLPLPARRGSTSADLEGNTVHTAHSEPQEEQSLHILCNASENADDIFFDDITSSTPVKIENGCVTFTSTLSARFWVVSCLSDTAKQLESVAANVYRRLSPAPFLAHFVVFARRQDQGAVNLRVLCVTDDRLSNEVLETQESYREVARSLDVEVLDGMTVYAGLVGNLRLSSRGNQEPSFRFSPFQENRMFLHAELQEALTSSSLISAGKPHANGPAEDDRCDAAAPDGAIIFLSDAAGLAQEQQTLCCLSLKVPEYVPFFGSRSSLHKPYEIGDSRGRTADSNKGTDYVVDETIVPLHIERILLSTTRHIPDRSLSKRSACEWLGRELAALLSRSSQPADRYDAAQNALPPEAVEPCSDVTSEAECSLPRQLELVQEEEIVPCFKPRTAAAVSLAVLDLSAAAQAPLVEKEKHDGRQQPADPQLISGERLSGGAPARRNLTAAAADAAFDTPDGAVVASPDGSGGDSQQGFDEPIDDSLPVDENENDKMLAGAGALEEELLVPQNASTSAAAAPAVKESPNIVSHEFRNTDRQVARSEESTFEDEACSHQLKELVPGVDSLSLVVSRQAEHCTLADAPVGTWNDNSADAGVPASSIVAVDRMSYMREAPIRLGSEYRSSVKRVVRETHFGCDDKVVEQYSARVCDQAWLTTDLPAPATMEAGYLPFTPDSVSLISPSCRVDQGKVYLSGPPSSQSAGVSCRDSAGISFSHAGDNIAVDDDDLRPTVLFTGSESVSPSDQKSPMQCWNKIVELDEEMPGNSELRASTCRDGGSPLAVGNVFFAGGSVSSRTTLPKRHVVSAQPASPSFSDIGQKAVGGSCPDAFPEPNAVASNSDVGMPCATSSSTVMPCESADMLGLASLQPVVRARLVEKKNPDDFALSYCASSASVTNGDSLVPAAYATPSSDELEVTATTMTSGGLADGSIELLLGEADETSKLLSKSVERPSESELLSKPVLGEPGASIETELLLVQEKTAVCEVCPGIGPGLVSPEAVSKVWVSSMQHFRCRDPTDIKNSFQPLSASLGEAAESYLSSHDSSHDASPEDMPPAEAVAVTSSNLDASFQAVPAEQPEVSSELTIGLEAESARLECLPDNSVVSITTTGIAKESEPTTFKPCDGPVVATDAKMSDSVPGSHLSDTAVMEAATAPPVLREVEALSPYPNKEHLADSNEAEQDGCVRDRAVEQQQGKVFPSTDIEIVNSRTKEEITTMPRSPCKVDAPSHGNLMLHASSLEAVTATATLKREATDEASLEASSRNQGVSEPEWSDASPVIAADSERLEVAVTVHAAELSIMENASLEARIHGISEPERSTESLVLAADSERPVEIVNARSLELEVVEEVSSEVKNHSVREPEQNEASSSDLAGCSALPEEIVTVYALREEASLEVRSQWVSEPDWRAESSLLAAKRDSKEAEETGCIDQSAVQQQQCKVFPSTEAEVTGARVEEETATVPQVLSEADVRSYSNSMLLDFSLKAATVTAASSIAEDLVKAQVSDLEATQPVMRQDFMEPALSQESAVFHADIERPEKTLKVYASELKVREEASSEERNQGASDPEWCKDVVLFTADRKEPEEIVKAHAVELQAMDEASSEVSDQGISKLEWSKASPVLGADNVSKEAEQASCIDSAVEEQHGKAFPSTDAEVSESSTEKEIATMPQIVCEAVVPSHSEPVLQAFSLEAATAANSISEDSAKAHTVEREATQAASSDVINLGNSEPEWSEESPVLSAESDVKAHALQFEVNEEVSSSEVRIQVVSEPEWSKEVFAVDSERPTEIVEVHVAELKTIEEAALVTRNEDTSEPERSEESSVLPGQSERPEEITKAHAFELEASYESPSSEVRNQSINEPECSEAPPVLAADSERPFEIVKVHASEIEIKDEAPSEVRNPDISETEWIGKSSVLAADSERCASLAGDLRVADAHQVHLNPEEQELLVHAAGISIDVHESEKACPQTSMNVTDATENETENVQTRQVDVADIAGHRRTTSDVSSLQALSSSMSWTPYSSANEGTEIASVGSSVYNHQDASSSDHTEVLCSISADSKPSTLSAGVASLNCGSETSSRQADIEIRRAHTEERPLMTDNVLAADDFVFSTPCSDHKAALESINEVLEDVDTDMNQVMFAGREVPPVDALAVSQSGSDLLLLPGESPPAVPEISNSGCSDDVDVALQQLSDKAGSGKLLSTKNIVEAEQLQESPSEITPVFAAPERTDDASMEESPAPSSTCASTVLLPVSHSSEATTGVNISSSDAIAAGNVNDLDAQRLYSRYAVSSSAMECVPEKDCDDFRRDSATIATDRFAAEGSSVELDSRVASKNFDRLDVDSFPECADKRNLSDSCAAPSAALNYPNDAIAVGQSTLVLSNENIKSVVLVGDAVVGTGEIKFLESKLAPESSSTIHGAPVVAVASVPASGKQTTALDVLSTHDVSEETSRSGGGVPSPVSLIKNIESVPGANAQQESDLKSAPVHSSISKGNELTDEVQRSSEHDELDSVPLPTLISSGKEQTGLKVGTLTVIQPDNEDALSPADAANTAIGTVQVQLPLLSSQSCITTCAIDGDMRKSAELAECALSPSGVGLASIETVDTKTDGQLSDEVIPKVSSQVGDLPASSTPCNSSVAYQNLASYQMDGNLAVDCSAATKIHQDGVEIGNGNATDVSSTSDNVECTSLARSELTEEIHPPLTRHEISADGMFELNEQLVIDSAGPLHFVDMDKSQIPTVVAATCKSEVKKENDPTASSAISFERQSAEPSAEWRPVFSVDSAVAVAAVNHDVLGAIIESLPVNDCKQLPTEPIDQLLPDQSNATLAVSETLECTASQINAGPVVPASDGETIVGNAALTGDISKSGQTMPASSSANSEPRAAIENTWLPAAPPRTDDADYGSQKALANIAALEAGVLVRLSSESNLREATLCGASALAASAEASHVAGVPDGQPLLTSFEQPAGELAPTCSPQPDEQLTVGGSDSEPQTAAGASQMQQPATDPFHDSCAETVVPLAATCCFTASEVDSNAAFPGDEIEIPHSSGALSVSAALCDFALPEKLVLPATTRHVQCCDPLAAAALINDPEELEQVAGSKELITDDQAFSISHVSVIAASHSPTCERPIEQLDVVRNGAKAFDIVPDETSDSASGKSLVIQVKPEEVGLDHDAIAGGSPDVPLLERAAESCREVGCALDAAERLDPAAVSSVSVTVEGSQCGIPTFTDVTDAVVLSDAEILSIPECALSLNAQAPQSISQIAEADEVSPCVSVHLSEKDSSRRKEVPVLKLESSNEEYSSDKRTQHNVDNSMSLQEPVILGYAELPTKDVVACGPLMSPEEGEAVVRKSIVCLSTGSKSDENLENLLPDASHGVTLGLQTEVEASSRSNQVTATAPPRLSLPSRDDDDSEDSREQPKLELSGDIISGESTVLDGTSCTTVAAGATVSSVLPQASTRVAVDVLESTTSSLGQETTHRSGVLHDELTVVPECELPSAAAVTCQLKEQQPMGEQQQLSVDTRLEAAADVAVRYDASDHLHCDMHEQVKGIEDEDASRDSERQAALSQSGPVDADPSDSMPTTGEVPNATTNEEASPGCADVEMPVERVMSISEMLAEPERTVAAVPQGKSSSDPHEPRRQEVGDMSDDTTTIDVVLHSAVEPSPVQRPDSPEPSLKQEVQPNCDVVDALSPSDQMAACSSDGVATVASPSEAKNEAASTLSTDSQEQISEDVQITSQSSSPLAADEAPSNDVGGHEHVNALNEETQPCEEVQHVPEVPSQQQLLQPTTSHRTAEEEDYHQTRMWETTELESSTSASVLADEGRNEEDDEVLYNEWEESECEGYIAADGSIVYTKIVKKQVQEDIRIASSTRSRHPSSPSAVPSSETPEAAVSLQFGFDSAALPVPTSLSSVPPSLSRGAGEIDYEEVRPDGSLVHRRVTVTVALGSDANVGDVVGAGSQSSSSSLEQMDPQKHQPQASVGRPADSALSRDVANGEGETNVSKHINILSGSEKGLLVDQEYLSSPDEDERQLPGDDSSSVEPAFDSTPLATTNRDRTEDSILAAAAAAAAAFHYAPSLYFIRQLSAVEELSETDSLDRYDGSGGESGARSRQSFTRASTLDDPRSGDDGCFAATAIATQPDASRRPGCATATATLPEYAGPQQAIDGVSCGHCGRSPHAAGGSDSSSSTAVRTSPIGVRQCSHCRCVAAALGVRTADDETGDGGGLYALRSTSGAFVAQDESGEDVEGEGEKEQEKKTWKRNEEEKEKEDDCEDEEEQTHERYNVAAAPPRESSLPVPSQSSTATDRGALTANDEGDSYSCDTGELSSSLHEFEELERAAELLVAAPTAGYSADAAAAAPAAAGECALGASSPRSAAASDALSTDD